jgi:hypothetical protein
VDLLIAETHPISSPPVGWGPVSIRFGVRSAVLFEFQSRHFGIDAGFIGDKPERVVFIGARMWALAVNIPSAVA